MSVVGVCGNPAPASKTLTQTTEVVAEIAARLPGSATEVVDLSAYGGKVLAWGDPDVHEARVRMRGADLVVSESCAQWDECAAYTAVYPVVLDVEYERDPFERLCTGQSDPATHDPRLSVILRDHDLAPRTDPAAVHETCAR